MKFSDHQPFTLTDQQCSALAEQLDQGLGLAPTKLADCAMAALGAAVPLQHQPLRVLARCSAAIAYQVMHAMGGDSYYLPLGVPVGYSDRDRELIQQFTGKNHRELARKFNISAMRVRQILWKQSPPVRRGKALQSVN